MNINEKISVFSRANDPKPRCEIPLWGFCQSVRLAEFAPEIENIRNTEDYEKRQFLKKRIPAVIISGTFSHRCAEGLIKPSGFICLDFDAKDNPQVKNWKEARNNIGNLKEVVFCAISASGKGCFAIIPIAYPNRFKDQFEALKRDFKTLGYTVDGSCGDVCRLRFVSSDPEATFKTDVKAYNRVYEPEKQTRQIKSYHDTNEDEIFNRIKAWLDAKEMFIAGNRNHYITQLAGALHRFGVSHGYALKRCLEFAESGFTSREIEACVKTIYNNSAWESKVDKNR